jgi:1,2-phenylacetyl-CoA epoxidase catalytic subunit
VTGEHRTELPRAYHAAVEHWQRHNFPDYLRLAEVWDRYFPRDEPFCLCAKIADGIPDLIEVGDLVGEPKAKKPADLRPEAAHILLGQVRAQASTEFGSIQQHQPTLYRAQDPQDQAWALRVMAEELRHGYQMIHLLTSVDWSSVSDTKPADMVEEILGMQTGSHVLAAFNLEFDSFVDNVVFAAFIDRVGKYQLTMQKVSAYKPYASSMPPMLKEEAFHLAAGVVPLRRWVEAAAHGDGLIAIDAIQRACVKWFTRALEMFGDDRPDSHGGEEAVKLGLKDMSNRQAQDAYIAEVGQMLDDLNERYVRAKRPDLSRDDASARYDRLKKERTKVDGIAWDDLLRLPDRRFFRRRGEGAFEMWGFDGERFDDAETYIAHVASHLPEAYRASVDVKHWADALRKVHAGEMKLKDAIKSMPRLARVGGACPCSRSVRWVVEDAAGASGDGARVRP